MHTSTHSQKYRKLNNFNTFQIDKIKRRAGNSNDKIANAFYMRFSCVVNVDIWQIGLHFFTARRYARSLLTPSVRLSVRPSVCHVGALYPDG